MTKFWTMVILSFPLKTKICMKVSVAFVRSPPPSPVSSVHFPKEGRCAKSAKDDHGFGLGVKRTERERKREREAGNDPHCTGQAKAVAREFTRRGDTYCAVVMSLEDVCGKIIKFFCMLDKRSVSNTRCSRASATPALYMYVSDRFNNPLCGYATKRSENLLILVLSFFDGL